MPLSEDKLAAIVRDATSEHGAAAFGAAVLVDDQIIKTSRGQANPELEIAMTDDTLVQIGSTTKLFNAAVVMRLAERGVLDLDQPVSEIIDGFRLADSRATETVTVRHCLTMTSGIDSGQFLDLGSNDDCLARYVATLADEVHLYPPGAGFSYSNAGCVVAGHAAEVASGKRWDDLLEEYVFSPAGMRDTETLTERLLFKRVAVGMTPTGEAIRPWTLSRSMGPAGSTCASTASDLIRFARIFLDDGSVDGTQVLAPESVATMTEPVVEAPTGFPADRWCVGAGSTQTETHAIFGHPGFNLSGCSLLWWIPDLHAAVACVTNSPTAYGAMNDCANQILELLGCAPPAVPQPAPVTDAIPSNVTGVYECRMVRYEVTKDDDALFVNVQGRGLLEGLDITSKLIPAGRYGYLPEQPLQPGFTLPTAISFRNYGGVEILAYGNVARKVSG